MKKLSRDELASRARSARYSTMLAKFLEARPDPGKAFFVGEWIDALSLHDFRDLMNDLEAARGKSPQAREKFDDAALLCFDIFAAEIKGKNKHLSHKKIAAGVRDLLSILALVDLRDRELVRIVAPLKLCGSSGYGVVVTDAGIAAGKTLGFLP